MPLFEYRCSACAHLEEVLQKLSDPAPAVCEKCGAAGTLAKEISRTSFQLKGGGWYKDLYSSTTSSSESKPTSGTSGASSGGSSESAPASSSTASESKPAASTESKPAAPTPSSSATSAA